MTFGHPWWLAGGVAACVLLLWVWRVVDARQRAAIEKFVSPHLRAELTQSISVTRRRVQRGLYLAAVISLFAALAGPRLGFRWVEINRRGPSEQVLKTKVGELETAIEELRRQMTVVPA